MSTPFELDAQEWQDARTHPLPRHGHTDEHPIDCRCTPCILDDYDPAEEHR